MYVSSDNKKKIILCSALIALAMMMFILGRTLSNTLLLTQYSLDVLPWFYLVQSTLLVLTSIMTGKFQSKYPKQFAIKYKIFVVLSLVIFMIINRYHLPGSAFIMSIVLWTYTGITIVIAMDYASDTFDAQEYKRFNWLLQSSGTLGVIFIGVLVAYIPAKYDVEALLGIMLIIELTSIFFVTSLSTRQISSSQTLDKNPASLSKTIQQNSLFKYLALTVIFSAFISTLVDYSFKFSLATEINTNDITYIVNLVYVISTFIILMVQIFFLDFLLKKMGSKKLVLIFPLVMLISSLITLCYPSFALISILFVINQIAQNTTMGLSKNLCLNIVPQTVRRLGRVYLEGAIKPIGIALTTIPVYWITYSNSPRLCQALIVLSSLYTLYLSRHVIKGYTVQLTQSVYLRRFNPNIINISARDAQEIEIVINQSLHHQDTDVRLFALQLLSNEKIKKLPPDIATLLDSTELTIQRECARLLATHRDQREFESVAARIFSTSHDDKVRWLLSLYLLVTKPDFLLNSTTSSKQQETLASQCIVSLIYLKLGDIQQQISALEHIMALYQSPEDDKKKWFLHILQEMPNLHCDEYLINIINKSSLPLKILAVQQVGLKPDNALTSTMINHIGTPGLLFALSKSLIRLGDSFSDQIAEKMNQTNTYSVKIGCLLILSHMNGQQSEHCLMDILRSSHDMVIKTLAAKYLAYRGVEYRFSDSMRVFITQEIIREISFCQRLYAYRQFYDNTGIRNEINSRIFFLKKRILYYLTTLSGSVEILNSIPLLTNVQTSKNQTAIALELIDSNTENRVIASQLLSLFAEHGRTQIKEPPSFTEDPFLENCICTIESQNMTSIYLLTKLRKLDLFKNLAAETLLVVADCCVSKDMTTNEVIFNEGDPGDGLYLIDSGSVDVSKQGIVISHLTEGEYFGELALLVDTPRYATVTAKSEGALIFIRKQDFDRITDEVPEIMKNITRQVIYYLTNKAQTEGGSGEDI